MSDPAVDFSSIGGTAATSPAAAAPTTKLDFSSVGGVAVDNKAPAAEPSWRERTLNYLTAPKSEIEDKQAGADSTLGQAMAVPNYAARRALGGVASVVLHPWDTIKAAAKQTAEATAAALANNPYQSSAENTQRIQQAVTDAHAELDKAQAAGQDPGMILKAKAWLADHAAHAHADTLAQVDQIKQNLVKDPVGTIAEMAGQAAILHGVSETGAVAKRFVAGKAADTASSIGKSVLGVSPSDTATIARETGEANLKADAAATEKNRIALERHSDTVDSIRDSNQQELDDHSQRLNDARAKAAADQTAATQAATDAATADTERGQLARREIELRQRIMDRARSTKSGAKSFVDSKFNEVRKLVNQPSDETLESTAQDQFGKSYSDLEPEERQTVDSAAPTPMTPLAPLAEAVGKATDKFKGSDEKVRVFSDIMRRAKDTGEAEYLDQLRHDIMQGQGMGTDYDALPDSRKAIVDKITNEMSSQQAEHATSDPALENSITFDHLRGYSTELGKAIRTEADGDVRGALKDVKAKVDDMAQHMANQAGAGSKLKSAKQFFYHYKDIFDEAAGPSGSGSPVAKSVNAEDSFNATQPFLSDEPQVAGRARQLLVGRKGITPHFDPGAGSLIDNLRDVKTQQEALPKPTATDKTISTAAAATPEQTATTLGSKYGRPVRYNPESVRYEFTDQTAGAVPEQPGLTKVAEPKLKPEPEAPVPVQAKTIELTPERLAKLKQDAARNSLDSMKRWTTTDLRKVGLGTMSLISGLAGLGAGISPWMHALELAGAGSAFAWAGFPKVVGYLLDRPTVIEALTKPSLADLREIRALPESQRPGVEYAIKQLSDEALRRGKLKRASPMLAVLGAMNKPARDQAAARAATQAKSQQAQLQAIQQPELEPTATTSEDDDQ